MLVLEKRSIHLAIELSLREESYVLYAHALMCALMTRQSSAVKMRNAIPRNHLNCNPSYTYVYLAANDVTRGDLNLGKGIFTHRMFTNVERTQSSTYPFCFGCVKPLSFQFSSFRQPRGNQSNIN